MPVVNVSDFIEPDFPFIIIKTKEDHVKKCKGDLYEATRKAWKINRKRAEKYEYVFSTIDTVVQEVYKVESWSAVLSEPGRSEFSGTVATDIDRSKYVGHRIPERFRKKGNRGPVLYSKKA